MHVIGTAGHVDHGKSALVEKLTGTDPDRLEEEKRRGLTIDLGFARLELPSGKSAGIVDVPGHERFIKNMLAGAGAVNVCLFVVAANEGWKPQSLEHLAILDILQVRFGVMAVTKSDTVGPDRIAAVTEETRARLEGTSLAQVEIVPCSAKTGQGIADLLAALDRTLEKAPPPSDLGKPRMWIDRAFTISGAGTVVTGTLFGGSLRRGQDVAIVPEELKARVRSLQSHSHELEEAAPGNRVALNLSGLGKGAVKRGDAVVQLGAWSSSTVVDALIRIVPEKIGGARSGIRERGSHLLYVGSAETPVRVKIAGPDRIEAGASGHARLYLRDPLPLVRGDRFVLRDAGRVVTLGGGIVLDPAPTGSPSSDAHIDYLNEIDGTDPGATLAALVRHSGLISASEAFYRSGTTTVPSEVIALGPLFLSAERLEEEKGKLLAALREHHRSEPLEPGLRLDEARGRTDLDRDAFDALVSTLNEVEQEEAVVRLREHRVSLSPAEEQERGRLLSRIGDAGFSPPLRSELGADPDLLRALTREGALVAVADFFLTKDAAETVKGTVREAIEREGPLSVAQIRDILGTTRKYAVPICEWLDATGATLRRGDTRILGPRA
jgi:selenocysteine-specific elongation factor